jgi:selenocysteine lyase/cysteine desulfurase
MLNNQKSKFRIPDAIHYLNCAYMSPLLKEIEQIGHQAITKKCFPFQIKGDDFFADSNKLKKTFASLIKADDYQNIAIIPSVSYGIANVVNNISLQKNDEILLVDEQFPSNVYSWKKLTDKYQAKLVFAKAPKLQKGRGKKWNANILELITDKTKVIALPHVHWSDGTLFDLKEIRKKANKVNALLVIDGTQSVGALPFSVKDIKPDALICAGYKWLFGPYSIGLAYYSDKLCTGNPIEENWINRKNSENFAGLVNYESDYQPKAGRFNVGEMSNFALTPMLLKAIEQILKWQPENIQQYTKEISKNAILELQNLGCFIEEENYRGNHLFGIYLPDNINVEKLKETFAKNNIFVSFRGNAIRISPHLYNTKEDFDILVNCFKDSLKK